MLNFLQLAQAICLEVHEDFPMFASDTWNNMLEFGSIALGQTGPNCIEYISLSFLYNIESLCWEEFVKFGSKGELTCLNALQGF